MLVLLYTMSTLYHAFRGPRVKKVFRILDHSCIYLLIAGTYTPFCLVTLRGSWGWSLFGVIWGLAVLGITFKSVFGHRWEILSREFAKVKAKLLQQLTNFGQPIIEVVDANEGNRGELLLEHRHDGVDLQGDYSKDTLQNLQQVWRRPVALKTRVEGRGMLQRFDGKDYSEKKID